MFGGKALVPSRLGMEQESPWRFPLDEQADELPVLFAGRADEEEDEGEHLEKDPQRRYPSARKLAEDLQRYRRNEPIEAVPVSSFERLRKWSKRNPVATALVTVTALLLVAVLAIVQALRIDAALMVGPPEIVLVARHACIFLHGELARRDRGIRVDLFELHARHFGRTREIELGGGDADVAVPGLRMHLDGCPACREEHASLVALLAADRGR